MNTVASVTFVRGLTLEFAQVDESMVSDNPGRNGDVGLLLCKLIF